MTAEATATGMIVGGLVVLCILNGTQPARSIEFWGASLPVTERDSGKECAG
jgi:hypothetical protein